MARSIGDLAEAAGVATSTVRYYERRGLLSPLRRAKGDYRQYDEGSLIRLRFIRAAQDSGFTLADITELLGLMDDERGRCDGVQAVLTQRLDEVRDKLRSLREVESRLAASLTACRQEVDGGPCRELVEVREAEETS